MGREELKKAIIEVLAAQIPEMSETSAELKESDLVINNLGLKSADGIYFAVALSDVIGIEIEEGDQSPFFDDCKGRDRTIGELIDWALPLVQRENGDE